MDEAAELFAHKLREALDELEARTSATLNYPNVPKSQIPTHIWWDGFLTATAAVREEITRIEDPTYREEG